MGPRGKGFYFHPHTIARTLPERKSEVDIFGASGFSMGTKKRLPSYAFQGIAPPLSRYDSQK